MARQVRGKARAHVDTPIQGEDAIVIDSMICGVDAMVQRIFPEVKKKIAEKRKNRRAISSLNVIIDHWVPR